MPNISAEEWQLLSFFEIEPELRDADVPWDYNDALYRVQQGDLTLSVAIAPAYRDIRLILKCRTVMLYELNAVGVKDIRYRNEHGAETLEIQIADGENLTLRIKPQIELHQEKGRYSH